MTTERNQTNPRPKPCAANTTYRFCDSTTGKTVTGLTKEQAAREVLAQAWTTNYYIDFGRDEDGAFSVGGERHFIDSAGDWDCESFSVFTADTLDEVLDFILTKEMNHQVFDEADEPKTKR